MTALQISRSTQTFRPQQPAGSRSYLTYSSASMSFVLRKYSRLAGFIEPLTGLPKGMPELADKKTEELLTALWQASEQGRYMIVCDQSPCVHRLKEYIITHPSWRKIHLYEPAEFIAGHLIDKLTITPLHETVAVHYTCSTRKMQLTDTLLQLASMCADKVIVPDEVGCCAFAGDKGFTDPELNKWALRKLRRQLVENNVTLGVSNSRTCEIGLALHGGVSYINIAALVNRCAAEHI